MAQFDAVMTGASQRKFDVLLFWKLDTLSREGVRQTLRYLEQLDSWGIRWRSFTEQFFDSCGIMRDVVISIMATLAEQERINISDSHQSWRPARKAGKRLGGKPIRVDMAAVQRCRHAGESLRAIARSLKVSQSLLVKKAKLQP